MTPMLPAWTMLLLYLRVGLSLQLNPETGRAPRITAFQSVEIRKMLKTFVSGIVMMWFSLRCLIDRWCKEEIIPMVPPVWIMVLLRLQDSLRLHVTPKWAPRDLEGPTARRLLPLFERWIPWTPRRGQPSLHYLPPGQGPRFPRVGWK